MSEQDVVAGFAELFQGRTDAYGLSTDTGVECVRQTASNHQGIISDHLYGEADWGCYPMVLRNTHDGPGRGEWMVHFGVVDLDIRAEGKTRFDFDSSNEAGEAASRLIDTMKDLGVYGWPEETKSGGYHVWTFPNEWVDASVMRTALLFCCEESDVPTTEVNPKQSYLPDGSSLGNFIRLPYPGGLMPDYDGKRSICGFDYEVEEFVSEALATRYTADRYARIASQYRKPMAPAPLPFVGEPVEVTRDWLNTLPGFIRFLLKDGMGKQTDRSAWLFRLACVCQEEGLSTDDAVAAVGLGDSLHCFKYCERADSERQYRTIVTRAYSNE